ncbi:hypothetical protein HCN44_010810 [Aphidius gifuensis]|uniref:RNA helicase n=1 Tax=Aphidius gifuensis TaxID=684658 RepID=A0A834Y318_APHGI|nr:hypothetical protein HCN44_010810 [Aphidius gifuensis]
MSDSDENPGSPVPEIETKNENITATWESLGLEPVLCQACRDLKWEKPSPIQIEAIPHTLAGAFALPILNALLENAHRSFALVLTPTRELAFQISEQFEALGSSIATPGRLVDHLENTKGFELRSLKFLVMDEADRILNMDFEVEVNKILRIIPRERRTLLFSATMTKKVQKLQRASLKDPVKLQISTKYQTVDKLQQSYLFIPSKYKDVYLVHILNELAGNSFMIFCGTCVNTIRTAMILRKLGFMAVPLNGQMNQNKRLAALTKFKAKNRSILISTDVASRGLDIPHVDIVINLDIPTHSKDYIHRVGRTARAGRSGRSITFVTQYDVELYQRIEQLIGKKLPLYKTEEDDVMILQERVSEAERIVKMEMKDNEDCKKSGKRKRSQKHDDDDDNDDTEQSFGGRKRVKSHFSNKGKGKPRRK